MIKKLVVALLVLLPAPALAVNVEKVVSPGGIEAWLVQDHANPIIAMEVAFAESGGWDTHVAQGTAQGSFARHAQDLSASIAAFWTDLGEGRQDEVVLMTMTEFGRTVRENGSGGTDHGRGSCLFVLGNQVQGGRVHGRLPALSPDNLEDGRDLPVTTDFRSVFSEVAAKHLRFADDSALFPGWKGPRLPLLRA